MFVIIFYYECFKVEFKVDPKNKCTLSSPGRCGFLTAPILKCDLIVDPTIKVILFVVGQFIARSSRHRPLLLRRVGCEPVSVLCLSN